MAQLSAPNFQKQAAQELLEIRNEILDLATDRDIYWMFQREIIQRNPRLLTTRSPFFEMINNAYAHATASRVRRLVDRDYRTISLRRLIECLGEQPDLWAGKIVPAEMKEDLAQLDKTCEKVKAYVDQFVAHHDRKSSVSVPTHRQLNEAVDVLIQLFRKYYAIINEADIDVVVRYLEEPLSIFQFAWIDSKVSSPSLRSGESCSTPSPPGDRIPQR